MSQRKTALLSAYDKTGLEEFARTLIDLGFNLLGSAGTTKHLTACEIPCRDVAEIVGPPILGHRVVTLSREIHAALLATDSEEDQAELQRLGIPHIDLVYVNLYPLEAEIVRPVNNLASVLEKTDIGGPTMLRSAAKGRRLVLCRSSEFALVERYLRGAIADAGSRDRFISYLAAIAEAAVSDYCDMSSEYHRKMAGNIFAEML